MWYNIIMDMKKCEICGLECNLTKHHLIPQRVCRSTKYSKKLKVDEGNFLWICEACHSKIHSMFSEQELRDYYFTKDALMSNESFAKFVKWRQKHPDFKGSSKMSNDRKMRR